MLLPRSVDLLRFAGSGFLPSLKKLSNLPSHLLAQSEEVEQSPFAFALAEPASMLQCCFAVDQSNKFLDDIRSVWHIFKFLNQRLI